jgi:hypothetical protein
MTESRVHISDVTIDPPATPTPARVRYRVTLRCGCTWWEDRDAVADPPAVGDMRVCCATHPARAIPSRPSYLIKTV